MRFLRVVHLAVLFQKETGLHKDFECEFHL